MSTEKATRYRRTKADITEDIRKAAVNQILKRGFSASLVTEIIKKAKIEPPVFYHRYKDLDEFFSEFVKGYDYWFSDIADKAMKSSDNPKDKFVALMDGLQEALKEKSVMQELLRWKLLREMTRPRGQPCFVKHSHFPLQRNTKLCLKTHALTLLRLLLFL